MSRLESLAKAGYFPTPPRVAAAVARHLVGPAPGKKGSWTLRALDPCAGTGEALAAVTAPLGAETFGIELHEQRAHDARERLDRVLHTSAFSTRLAHGAFSLLFLNPPYDEDTEKRRLEHAFLTSLTRTLCTGGVLVYVVPQRRLGVSARYLGSHYEDLRVYRFPDPEYRAFGQVVLFARKKAQGGASPEVQAQVEAWTEGRLPPLPDEPDDEARIAVPAVRGGEVLFATLFFDPAAAAAEAQRRGVWTQPQFAEQVWPPAERPVRPLMPLRKGHLAQLIAAGLLDNLLLCQDGQRLLVKGTTRKEFVLAESPDEHTTIEREVLRTSVVTLDLDSGAFEVVQNGAGAAHQVQGRASKAGPSALPERRAA
jgi:hypothetical protein